MTEDTAPPGRSLRDPAYIDLCGFFATFPEAQAWRPRFGDWVSVSPVATPQLVLDVGASDDWLLVAPPPPAGSTWQPRSACVWLPTLDQLRMLIQEHFGTTGFFSSTFKDSTYWYTGQMLGMTVTNLQPLAEGRTPEEAALKALLMRHQR